MFYRKCYELKFYHCLFSIAFSQIRKNKSEKHKSKNKQIDGFGSLKYTTSEQTTVTLVCRHEWLSRPRYLPQFYLRLRHSFSLHNLFNPTIRLLYPKYPYFPVNVRCFDLSMTYKNSFNRYICIPLQNVCFSSILKSPPVRTRNDVSTSLCKLTNR